MPQPEALPDAPAEPEALPDAPAEPEALPDAAAAAPAEHPLTIYIGRIADQYMRASHGPAGDDLSHYGLNDKNGQFYIGNDLIERDGNDFVIKGKRYRGTQGLWQLITMKRPELGFPTEDDKRNYGEIMVEADAIRHPDHPERPYKTKSFKWKKFIEQICDEYEKKQKHKAKREAKRQQKKTKGQGVFLPSDPNAL